MISGHIPTKEDIEEIKELFKDVTDSDLQLIKEIIYFDSWTGYEESDGMLIFKAIDDTYQVIYYGYSILKIMADGVGNYGEKFEPEEISKETVQAEIKRMNDQMDITNE